MASYQEMIVNVHSNKVVMWDTGPKKPGAPPARPALPEGKEGTPEYDLNVLEFQDELDAYKKALAAHREAKKEYDQFQTQWGGPYEIFNVWWVDARDMLKNGRCGRCTNCAQKQACESPRYMISSKSAGHSKLANGGLPAGVKPGRGQDEQLQRIKEGREQFLQEVQTDPVFGQVEMAR
jgi:hypothetical protein